MEKIKEKPKIKPNVDKKILDEIRTQNLHEEKRQVIVHCRYHSPSAGMQIRIWPTTYLLDNHSNHKSQLIHAYNITWYPVWKSIPKGVTNFTLIFPGLPSTCSSFDLFEDCASQGGGFFKQNIQRNKSDVYTIWLD
jgi:hypothetical protein